MIVRKEERKKKRPKNEIKFCKNFAFAHLVRHNHSRIETMVIAFLIFDVSRISNRIRLKWSQQLENDLPEYWETIYTLIVFTRDMIVSRKREKASHVGWVWCSTQNRDFFPSPMTNNQNELFYEQLNLLF